MVCMLCMKARIYRSAARVFDCCLEDTKEIVQATSLGSLLKGDSLVVGDNVEVSKDENSKEYTIVSRDDRSNEIFRNIVRENKKKTIAANLDLMVIVMAASKPAYKQGLLDRYLVRAFQWEIPTIVVFNKMDQYENDFDINFESERIEEIEADCFEVTALDETYQPRFLKNGLKELKELIENKTAIFLGQSGVGKSKLITLLSSGKAELKSREVGKVGKGTHTTTWAEAIDCDSFLLIDSPGVRTFSMDDLTLEQLEEGFPDIMEKATQCKFKDCKHLESSKGCIFYQNAFGDQSKLIQSRLESFLRIKEEVLSTPDWQKK